MSAVTALTALIDDDTSLLLEAEAPCLAMTIYRDEAREEDGIHANLEEITDSQLESATGVEMDGDVDEEYDEDPTEIRRHRFRRRRRECPQRGGRRRQTASFETKKTKVSWLSKMKLQVTATFWATLFFCQLFHPVNVTTPPRGIGSRQPDSWNQKTPVFMDIKQDNFLPTAAPELTREQKLDKRTLEQKLRDDYGIVAVKVGKAIEYARPTYKWIRLNLEGYVNGTVLDGILKPHMDYLRKQAMSPKTAIKDFSVYMNEIRRVVVATKEDLLTTAKRIFDNHGVLNYAEFHFKEVGPDGEHVIEKREAVTVAIIVGVVAVVVVVAAKPVYDFISNLFDSDRAMKSDLEKLAKKLDALTGEAIFKGQFGGFLQQAKNHIEKKLDTIFTDLFAFKKLPRVLFPTRKDAADLLRELTGPAFFDNSIYAEEPFLGLDVLDVVEVRQGNESYTLDVKVTVPMLSRVMGYPIYAVEPVGGFSTSGVYGEPRLDIEHVVIRDFDRGDITTVVMNKCKQVSNVYFCSDRRPTVPDCNIKDTKGCRQEIFEKDYGQKEFVHWRQIEDLTIVATTAKEGYLVNARTGERELFKIPKRIFLVRLPHGTILELDGRQIIGGGAINAKLSVEAMKFESELSTDYVMKGLHDQKDFDIRSGISSNKGLIFSLGVAVAVLLLIVYYVWRNENGTFKLAEVLQLINYKSNAKDKKRRDNEKRKARKRRAAQLAQQEYVSGPGSGTEVSECELDPLKSSQQFDDYVAVLGGRDKKKVVKDANGRERVLQLFKSEYWNYKLLDREVQRMKQMQRSCFQSLIDWVFRNPKKEFNDDMELVEKTNQPACPRNEPNEPNLIGELQEDTTSIASSHTIAGGGGGPQSILRQRNSSGRSRTSMGPGMESDAKSVAYDTNVRSHYERSEPMKEHDGRQMPRTVTPAPPPRPSRPTSALGLPDETTLHIGGAPPRPPSAVETTERLSLEQLQILNQIQGPAPPIYPSDQLQAMQHPQGQETTGRPETRMSMDSSYHR